MKTESNPWPQWPLVCKTDYGQEEAIAVFGHDPRIYTTTVKEFKKDRSGNLKSVILVSLESKTDEKDRQTHDGAGGRYRKRSAMPTGADRRRFLGSQSYVTDAFKVKVDGRTNVATEAGKFAASVDKIFTAGRYAYRSVAGCEGNSTGT